MVKVGSTEAGARWPRRHTGHLTGSDAITTRCSASSASPASTASTSCSRCPPRSPAPGPTRSRRGRDARPEPGVCVYAISGGTGAHMADMLAGGGPAPPAAHQGRRSRPLHDGLIPAYLRVSNPVDCGGPPVADRARPPDPRRDPRRQERRHPRRADHGRGRDVQRAVHARPHRGVEDDRQADLRDLGRARRAPTTPTTSACSTAACRRSARSATACRGAGLRRLLDVRGAVPLAVRVARRPRRCPRPRRPASCSPAPTPGEALSESARSSCSTAYGIKTSQRRAVHVGREAAAEGRERDRLSRS